MAWDNNGNNKVLTPGHNISVAEGDMMYIDALKGKLYVVPVSGWFFTHFGSEVSYSKNWVFLSDLLWYTRWKDILNLGPRFIEIIIWNDYGESHYIGSLASSHTDDGASEWVMDMSHGGWLQMSKPFIFVYKAGDRAVDSHIEDEKLVYWYRFMSRTLNCNNTDFIMRGSLDNSTGNFFRDRSNGWEIMQDQVFVVSLFKFSAMVEVILG
ncbi:uncharacterized protein LDX57_003287 [Aspergillus melleus]|uniref:uncharacterized protein n=1 Tax=Aspergillus melleus TaxID=138277 RepID=UPI001E8DE990|nr:uncharacterized protein LDX57_003287 [Aspergillus melleus]KAH8425536.1 hypothetical protein LDX57_003287 [Aspergillus melleus]